MKSKLLLVLYSFLLINIASTHAFGKDLTIKQKSGPTTMAVLELYTSEGCSSCPAAERYLKKIIEKHANNKQFIPLAFHVDYWDYIGWEDPFSDPKYGLRQRDAAQRNQLNSLYTPQFILYGKDFPAFKNIPEAIGIINDIKPRASIQVETTLGRPNQLDASITINADDERTKHYSNVYIALSENNLSSSITDGENEGLELHHQHVVRQFLGPFTLQGQDKLNIKRTITLDQEWKLADLNLVVFAEDSVDGTTHQAIQVPLKELDRQ